MKKITNEEIQAVAAEFDLPYASIKTVLAVESSGIGFDKTTGKIIIQFEPSWFKRKSPFTPSGKWSVNKVDIQVREWEAFNDAFFKNPNAAMESTSIGMMQVMGFHYKLLGFKTVGAMWDYAKESESNQLRLGLRFIKSNPKLYNGLVAKNWRIFAYYYNGQQYEKYGYHIKLANAYKLHSK